MTAESLRFDTGEVELAYRHWPGDSPPIVFLHGISTSLNIWEPMIPLRGRQEAYAYDARGHGESGRAVSYRWTAFGHDAVRFLESVVGEAAIMVGHSLGGMTAIYAAAECPDLVAAALLVEPTLYAPFGLRHFKEPFEQRKAMAGKPVEELLAAGIQEMQVPLPVRERAARQLMKLDGATLGQTLDGTAFEGWDTDVLLKRVQCPVLLEHGERTVGAGLAASALYEGEVERARTLIPNCTVVEIKGSGHIPMAQQPGKFAEVASGFIQKIVARG